jgi:hypothetical protein
VDILIPLYLVHGDDLTVLGTDGLTDWQLQPGTWQLNASLAAEMFEGFVRARLVLDGGLGGNSYSVMGVASPPLSGAFTSTLVEVAGSALVSIASFGGGVPTSGMGIGIQLHAEGTGPALIRGGVDLAGQMTGITGFWLCDEGPSRDISSICC